MQSNKVFIIGKRSNLSKSLNNSIDNSYLISSNEIKEVEKEINDFKNINFIYNTSPKSDLLKYNQISPASYSNYSLFYLSNFIDLCKKYPYKINSILYTSSCSLYGENDNAKEDDDVKITSLHSALKISSELFIKKFLEDIGINIVYARLFNMYGGNDNFSVISKIIHSIKNDYPFYLSNNGKAIRDFIHINDVVEIYKLMLKLDHKGITNIATGLGTSTKQIINIAEKSYNKKLEIININCPEVKTCVGSDELISKKLNYKKFIKLDDFINRSINE